jgi:hypothetical protein
MIRTLCPLGIGLTFYNAKKLAQGLVFPNLSYGMAVLLPTGTMHKKLKVF